VSPRRRSREWALVLFVVALLAFNPPILSIFSVPDLVFGIPLLYVYIFAAWGCVIALLALNESGFATQSPEEPAPGLPMALPGPRGDDAGADLPGPLPDTPGGADARPEER
jgi:hypothetical protein